MKALVSANGRVAELAEQPFPVAPPLEWIDAPPDTTTRHTWDGERFVPPPPLPPPEPPAADRFEVLIDKLVARGALTAADRVDLLPGRGGSPR